MSEDIVTTGVDELLIYLRGHDRVSLQEAADVLHVPLETLQAWTDFLVEEKILGIEYKFTKPFIYLNKEEKPQKAMLLERTAVALDAVKDEYFERARTKQIPENKIPELWRDHVKLALFAKKAYFMEQASKRNAANPLHLWEEYQQDLVARC